MNSQERKVVRLDTAVQVHLLYFTAWVDDDGVIHFRDDVYGRDRGARAWLGCRAGGAREVANAPPSRLFAFSPAP